ncbi:regulatory protein RecX [Beijerinckia indica]|uniref:Regulatory protein RecX n=1 Tax=Beijerinckia indica subsp. indica (strain ATCC 9039 / DSM 1715 / NCIMB 8712) TaxID=395963 RepID=B2IG94_BEII9|nr:regulatory protein RecX [Beijerinckia indica]ACB97168.1 regulatory protein RecX [Beijerinckia indica subsp. indica ATCC 9039]
MPGKRPDLEPDALRALALRYLGRYAVSAQGLAAYLKRKIRQIETQAAREDPSYEKLDPALLSARLAQVIERMKEVQLLDDKTFAQARVTALQSKGFSRRRIEADLASKGLRDEATTETLDALDPLEQARLFARRKRLFPRPGEMPEKAAKRRDKALAALLRQGFPYQIARQVLLEGE